MNVVIFELTIRKYLQPTSRGNSLFNDNNAKVHIEVQVATQYKNTSNLQTYLPYSIRISIPNIDKYEILIPSIKCITRPEITMINILSFVENRKEYFVDAGYNSSLLTSL
ncbi:hypothetical protein EWB00_009681 [Schistosoma japonicum]|uniref:Uncharacterized protein n=1 Tax=Schistosoma japonicum TaxID=6182 RepID=A0A4Z2CM14_SCHJA|nr:hypothetical protein EWB00_009681 [Schistosoma japonicum]